MANGEERLIVSAEDGSARMNRPRIVVLPGLDGTGLMLGAFADALRPFFQVDIVAYPGDLACGYDGLLDHVRARLPSDDYILIGESFSGPLALRIAQERPACLRALMLGASFARLDLQFKRILSGLANTIPVKAIPLAFLAPMLMGQGAGVAQRQELRDALSRVAPKVLALRAREALGVDLVRERVVVQQPLLYLRATADRLMPADASDVVASLCEDFRLREVAAPHFLFQTAPRFCARAILEFHEAIAQES